MNKSCLTFFVFLFLSLFLNAQEQTNAGREFWVTSSVNRYSYIMPDSALIYIMGDTMCTGYIENPNTSFYNSFTVIPDSVIIIKIPKEEILCNVQFVNDNDTTRTIESKGVYINTSRNVFVYLQTNFVDSIVYHSSREIAKVPILPLQIHTTEIRLNDLNNLNYSWINTNYMMIIAVEDNTIIQMPAIHLNNGSIFTHSFTVNLQKGEVFHFSPNQLYYVRDTNNVITTNCKRIVPYYTTRISVGSGFYGKRFKTARNKYHYYGKDFLLVKYHHPNFQKEMRPNYRYPFLGINTIFSCNQISTDFPGWISVHERLTLCSTPPPFISDVPFAFFRTSIHKVLESNSYIGVIVNFNYFITHSSTGPFMNRSSTESILVTNKNYPLPHDRMVKKWMVPTTKNNISIIPDSTYVDLVIFVRPEGINTTYINHQLIPATAFDTFPYTNGDYYFLQYGLFNDSIPDFFIIENEKGFSATIDEFGYNMRPNTSGLMDFIYFHNNDSGVNYYESPVPYSNLSPIDSATVYRCVGDQLHLEVEYNLDTLSIDWIVDGTQFLNTPSLNLPLNSSDTLTVQLILGYNCPDTTTTFVVVVEPPVIPLSSDTILCQGALLSVESPFAIHYLWSTGDTTAAIAIDTAGYYSVSVSNLGCQIDMNDIHIQLYPQSSVTLGNDSILCALATLVLNAEQPHPAQYLWQDLSTNITYTVQSDGQYWVIVTDECLNVSDTINVGYLYPFEIDLGNDTSLCEGQHLLLSAETPYCDYLWQDGTTEATYWVNYAGVYQVFVSNLCFNQTSDIEVSYQQCEQEIYIPTSFTPNADGINDLFIPIFTYPEKIESFSFSIFNRWGSLLFYTKDIKNGWDGKNAQIGVYTYLIKYKTQDKGEKQFTGSITIY